MLDFLSLAQTEDDISTYDALSPESLLVRSLLADAGESLGIEPPAEPEEDFSDEFDKDILKLIDAVALG